jgi:hypothetical protein
MSPSTQPLISLPALERALSPQRLRAYRLDSDRDETDGLARYLWNLALSNAIAPVLHVLEITFRNEISRAAAKLMEKRPYVHDRIPSWLDAIPTMLLEHEAEKVVRAKERLGVDPSSQTEGHLIAKLDFGFWVALCRDPYADWRASGPRLWPRLLDLAFRRRPADVTTRSGIHNRFDAIRQFRNRIAHHQPIWDRDYLAWHEYLLESLAWMTPKLADATRAMSIAPRTFADGPGIYRAHAETLLGTGPGLAGNIEAMLHSLDPTRRAFVASLVAALAAEPSADPLAILTSFATPIQSGSEPNPEA